MTILHHITKRIIITIVVLLIIGAGRMGYCSGGTCTTPGYRVETNQNNLSDAVYVDVREDDERAAGHVSGALHLPVGDIQAGQIQTLPKDKPLIIYCRSGRRSAIAIDILRSQGFTNLIDGGGMTSLQGVEIVR